MSEKLFQERRNMKKTKVTLRSLAQELGIAPATVLRALTNHPNVTQGLRRRVIALAQKYHYQLPEHYKKLVAVVIPGFEFEGYTGLLLSSLMKELSANQFHGEIISDCDLEVLQDHVYAGVISIVWTAGLEKQWPEEHATPLVVLNATSNPREGVCQVTSDEKQGITLGLEQLYNKGRRRIAFVSSQLNCSLNARKRVEAFHEFCRKKRISADSFHEEHTPDYDLDAIADNIIRKKADAVFAAGETYAPQLLFRLSRHGVRIPDDLSMLALEYHAVTPFTIPPLTALTQDFDELARQSVLLLLRRIHHQPSPAEILVPYHFIERESI